MILYSDSEVRVFHPLCERALNRALADLGLSGAYQVIHHRRTGSLEMDFVIENRATGRYLCVVEVKRTPGDVQSTRWQFQAESYVQMNAMRNEKPFFILTNLETLISFRHDAARPRIHQQMLRPGLERICNFLTDDEAAVEAKLAAAYKRLIGNFVKDIYDYSSTLEQFLDYMDSVASDDRAWKSSMAVLMYEYIRGAFDAVGRNDLKRDVRTFRGDVRQICQEAAWVGFDGIFQYDPAGFLPKQEVPAAVLSDVYRFGKSNISGEALADALHDRLSETKRHEGEVATDSELAQLVSTLARMSKAELGRDRKICDPAAGSGNLICSAINVFHVDAARLKANDVNDRLAGLLSLRLGLSFPGTIRRAGAPEVSAMDINDLPPSYFGDVDVVLLNPPFVAGINCAARKQPFYETIKRMAGREAMTRGGQMNLGAVFLEAVCCMVAPGTTIACIFPKAHLKERGDEAVAFRNMLLHYFGLHTIFHYPAEDLFEAVTEETCVFVGRAGQPAKEIKVYYSRDKVADIDLHALLAYTGEYCASDFAPILPGVEAGSFPASEFEREMENGWRFVCGEMKESMDFVSRYILSNPRLTSISDTAPVCRRGNVGSQGISDLVFFDSLDPLYRRYAETVALSEGMRNAWHDAFELNTGDAKFIDFNCLSEAAAEAIINDYIPLQRRPDAQERNTARAGGEIRKIAERYGRVVFAPNSVLVPTKIRKTGRVHVTRIPMHVSTNFAVFSYDTADKANVVGTYMSTVFYQLECEVQSKDHAGLRKLEVRDMQTTHVPKYEALSQGDIHEITDEIPHIGFLDLNHPVARRIDRIWAGILFGTDGEEILDGALRLLRFLADLRSA